MTFVLPERIDDVEYRERSAILDAVVERLDAGEPVGTGYEAPLQRVLDNPYAFQSTRELGAGTSAVAIWRLSVASEMSGAVLRHVADTNVVDPGLEEKLSFARTTPLAIELLKSRPDILDTALPDERTAFWKLVGYDPEDAEQPIDESVIGALYVMQYASTVPQSVMDRVDDAWAGTHTMQHPSEHKGTVIIGDDVAQLYEQPSEREAELDEAFIRVVCSAFAAERRGTVDDWKRFSDSMNDYNSRGSADALGFEAAMAVVGVLKSLGLCQQGLGRVAYDSVLATVNTRASEITLGELPLEAAMPLISAAHELRQLEPSLEGLDRLLSVGEATIANAVAFAQAVTDPALVPGRQDGPPSAQSILEAGRVTEHEIGAASLLAKLRGEIQTLTVRTEHDIERDLAEGYDRALVIEAFTMIASELNPDRKRQLFRSFNAALEQALERVSGDRESRLGSAEGLLELSDGSAHMGFLAYFPAGAEFVDDKLREFAKLAQRHIDSPEGWLNQQPHAPRMVSQWSQAVHDALWYNRRMYLRDKSYGIGVLTSVHQVILDGFKYVHAQQNDRAMAEVYAHTQGLQQFIEAFKEPVLEGSPRPYLVAPLQHTIGYFAR